MHKVRRVGWVLGSCILLLGLLDRSLVSAHGVVLGHTQEGAIRVYADYDTGEPMAGAQVRVFSPEDPQTPWLEGRVDPRGHFYFQPDPRIPGTWEVMIRQAGHGGLITVQVAAEDQFDTETESEQAISEQSGTLSPLHRGLMMGTTVWGFVGTALFFARRKG